MLDTFLANHQGEATTTAGYEPKVRLHIKPRLGHVKIVNVTDDLLDELYRELEKQSCPTNGGKPLGPRSIGCVGFTNCPAGVAHEKPGCTTGALR
ncbi:hypothetical protein [Streptomyces luteogriseus]|uniref:hypothetical protein n=1 Tax=Streptomyces luteogriseus TaxID=68233 RepID=UPI00367FF5D6